MSTANKDVKNLIITFAGENSKSIDILTMKLTGMVDAVVMGGIKNYEKVNIMQGFKVNIYM